MEDFEGVHSMHCFATLLSRCASAGNGLRWAVSRGLEVGVASIG